MNLDELKEVIIKETEEAEFKNLSDRQQAIVKILAQAKELRASGILEKLEDPPSERTLRRDLITLKRLGIIDSSGHAWTAVWFLKASR